MTSTGKCPWSCKLPIDKSQFFSTLVLKRKIDGVNKIEGVEPLYLEFWETSFIVKPNR